MNKAKKVMDLFEFETKYVDMVQKVIDKGFKQINRDLNGVYSKSNDKNNWFYVGGYTAESIAEGIKMLVDNFGNKHILKDVAELLTK